MTIRATVDDACNRQANTSMAVFEDDIGPIATNWTQVHAFLADATRGAVCKKWERRHGTASASARPPLGNTG
jgi:hypothetical protein